LAGKRLELLKDAVPKLARVAILWEPKNQGSEESWEESEVAAQALALKIHSMEVNSADKFESAFSQAIKAGSNALAVTLSALFTRHQKLILSMAAKYRLPAIYTREEFVDNGGLMCYGADEDEPFRRIAVMIDKILKGTKPADIPVEQPTKFELIVNLIAAKQIGVTIPPEVPARANRLIK
jgi:putative ABC transport system substrate-binding protein